ncbi:hypothetical protein RchiOBHm_Chr5g0006971 [Rosa chinensis]|uniref:Uncharacterized protein n=1 Tax=Rosa chinensis TaxID=74649 RepID=A0A2P6Q3P7_ROSCH|nr:hypothetical protein RchiOBHm_Chr5g0006971 [Rosa chinensis]
MWSKFLSLSEARAVADPSFQAKVQLAVKAATCASFAYFFCGTVPLIVRVVKTEREITKSGPAYYLKWKLSEEEETEGRETEALSIQVNFILLLI